MKPTCNTKVEPAQRAFQVVIPQATGYLAIRHGEAEWGQIILEVAELESLEQQHS